MSSLMKVGVRLHAAVWMLRATTLGVRAIVLDEPKQSVFLVRHTYLRGWYLPGGGVDRGESAEAAVVREAREEGGVLCRERPALFGLYRNGWRDHVACYVIKSFDMEARPPDREIADWRFFSLDALPDDASAATRARLAEVLEGRPIAQTW